MRFYLCQTANGPRYARTQGDAKPLDPKFATVEYATDQASLVDRFNQLLEAGRTLMRGATAPESDDVEEFVDGEPPMPQTTAPAQPQVIVRGLTPGEKAMALINARTNVEECIWVQDEAGLVKLEEIIAHRRSELAVLTPAEATPVQPRKRTRP